MHFIITTILAILALILSIYFYLKQRSRKEITFERISDVTAKGIKLVTLKLWNSGNIDIAKSDFGAPLKFSFGKGAKVANIVIVSTKPDSLKNTAEKTFRRDSQYSNKIMIAPFVFNAKYSITFQIQVVGFRREIIVENSTSIFGVYDILEIRPLAEAGVCQEVCVNTFFPAMSLVLAHQK